MMTTSSTLVSISVRRLSGLVCLLGLCASASWANPQGKSADVNNAGGLEHVELVEPMSAPPLWQPSTPLQNPYSESKRVLGKILFWDEQLSSDNTISCGTCHLPSSGGSDPRPGLNPGFDELFGTADDVIGSPGVSSLDAMAEYTHNDFFGLDPQIGGRVAQSNLMAMYTGSLFWDGRAETNFVDPETGVLMFQSGVAGLEIQASAPILNQVEMAHDGRTWDQVREKLGRVRPLALAESIPVDMLDAIEVDPTYGELFEEAFGDPEINAVRISFALATYQRTLVPDQTPWDLWNAGDEDAMTPAQITGFNVYQASACTFCHPAPTYANSDFFVDGVRPPVEDLGRQLVTGLNSDRGKFRTPSIRNVALRDKLMHTGTFEDIDDVFDHYARRNGRIPFPDNLNGFLVGGITFSPANEIAVKDFLVNGLTDPRVANETFPFDRPDLFTEQSTPNPEVIGSGEIGSGGFTPRMVASNPPNIGNADFKIGVDFALGGAQAWVAVSSSPPVGGVVSPDELIGPITLNGMGNGGGFGTLQYPIADDPSLDGTTRYMQWIVSDPSGGDGFARSEAARLDFFCTREVPCTIACVADFNGDGLSDFFDVSAFLGAFSAESSAADLTGDGMFDFFDVSAFLSAFGAGCP